VYLNIAARAQACSAPTLQAVSAPAAPGETAQCADASITVGAQERRAAGAESSTAPERGPDPRTTPAEAREAPADPGEEPEASAQDPEGVRLQSRRPLEEAQLAGPACSEQPGKMGAAAHRKRDHQQTQECPPAVLVEDAMFPDEKKARAQEPQPAEGDGMEDVKREVLNFIKSFLDPLFMANVVDREVSCIHNSSQFASFLS
jgi:hypothetical protein